MEIIAYYQINNLLLIMNTHIYITCSAIAYIMAIMHGKQQHTAIPIMHAKETQKTTKKTSNARNPTQSLSKIQLQKLNFNKQINKISIT